MLFKRAPTFFNGSPSLASHIGNVAYFFLQRFSRSELALNSRDTSFTTNLKKIGIDQTNNLRSIDPKLPEIRNISMVGAVYRQTKGSLNGMKGLFWRDAETLRRSLEYARDAGYPLSNTLNVSVVNIAYNRDFLTEDPKLIIPADLVISSFVYNPAQDMDECDLMLKKLHDEINPENARTSPKHHIPLAWHDAALRAGAKLITTFRKPHYNEEVNADHFKGPHITLQAKRENVKIGRQNAYILEALTYHQ